MKTKSLRTAMLALAVVPLLLAAAPSVSPEKVSATPKSCPTPSERELEIADRLVVRLLEIKARSTWRSDLGLEGATPDEAVVLIGSDHEATCAELQALAPLDDADDPYLYFQVRDVYIVVPAFLRLGERLVTTFKGEISYDTMHLSTF